MPSSFSEVPSFNGYNVEAKRRERSWTNTSNYRNVPRDALPTNTYVDKTYQVYQTSGGSPYRISSNGTITLERSQPLPFTSFVIFQAFQSGWDRVYDVPAVLALQNRLKLGCLSDVADQKINLAVALAEGRKTADMILGTAKRISRAYMAFKKGRLRDVARELDISPGRVHKNWLAYKYGWMPLLMDVKGAAEHFAQTQVGRPIRFSVQKSGVLERSLNMNGLYGMYGSGVQTTYYRDISWKYECLVKMWLEITNPNTSTLQQLGLTNPALVAWELVPFSFVFDWFISVGDWCKGLSALHGVTVRKALVRGTASADWTQVLKPTTYTSGVGSERTTYVDPGYSLRVKGREYSRTAFVADASSLTPPNKWAQLSENRENGTFVKLVTSLALLKTVHR